MTLSECSRNVLTVRNLWAMFVWFVVLLSTHVRLWIYSCCRPLPTVALRQRPENECVTCVITGVSHAKMWYYPSPFAVADCGCNEIPGPVLTPSRPSAGHVRYRTCYSKTAGTRWVPRHHRCAEGRVMGLAITIIFTIIRVSRLVEEPTVYL